jgi:hypothetical protein
MMNRFAPAFVLGAALALGACSSATQMAAPAPPAAPPVTAPAAQAAPPAAQAAPSADPGLDTVRAGRFDNGRMFTLDDPPRAYFREAYGFAPDDAWFQRAQLGALRFATYCSASFVSATGLILTNHHCARQSVTQVGLAADVDYNEDGFYARSRADEAPVEDLFVEQLISIDDVTDRVEAAANAAAGDGARQQARAAAIEAIQQEMGAARGEGYRVQVITLYAGGQYKAYTFRRYDDIRLVFAPETQMGYFGGDPDNFTYPRYSLDFSLFRAYGPDGQPLRVDTYFPFEPNGTDAGDLVFVLGNPGSTTRANTVAQLEYRRDISEPAILNYLQTREAVFGAFVQANPDDPRTPELTDTYFSLGNGRKAYTGRVEGLRDPYIMARRRAYEQSVRDAFAADPAVQAEYGDVIDRIAANRAAARESASMSRALAALSPASPYNGTAHSRAFSVAMGGGAMSEEALLRVEDQPEQIQAGLIAARLQDLHDHLGADHPAVQTLLAGRTPAQAAQAIVDGSALTTEARVRAALAAGTDVSADPAVQMVQTLLPMLQSHFGAQQRLDAEINELSATLARGRFEVYGTSVPPDATFSLRISDGLVRGYDYNGTVAPPYTTFYGLYDRYYSHCVGTATAEGCDWAVPQRWKDAVGRLDLSTPYNFSSTNDIIGGNSGSPILDRNLRVVGIAFDGNIESLPGNYIFIDTFNRTVSLDVRAMIESLDTVYNMDWVLDELIAR